MKKSYKLSVLVGAGSFFYALWDAKGKRIQQEKVSNWPRRTQLLPFPEAEIDSAQLVTINHNYLVVSQTDSADENEVLNILKRKLEPWDNRPHELVKDVHLDHNCAIYFLISQPQKKHFENELGIGEWTHICSHALTLLSATKGEKPAQLVAIIAAAHVFMITRDEHKVVDIQYYPAHSDNDKLYYLTMRYQESQKDGKAGLEVVFLEQQDSFETLVRSYYPNCNVRVAPPSTERSPLQLLRS